MQGYARVLYLDLALLSVAADLLFDYALLWATSAVGRRPSPARRLLLGALIGNAYFAAAFFASQGMISGYGWLRSPFVVFLVPAVMLFAAFAPLPARRLLGLAGYLYAIAFLSGGAGMAAAYAFGGSAYALPGKLVSIAALLVAAEVGWGVVSREVGTYVYRFPLEVEAAGKTARFTALLDTGNRLLDPLSGRPVIVVEVAAVRTLFPDDLTEVMDVMASGDFSIISRLLRSSTWSARLRAIPYRSLGQENGLLIGFRPDRVRMYFGDDVRKLQDVLIGLYAEPLDGKGGYQALVHPDAVGDAPTAETATRQGGGAIAGAGSQG